jgi:hypothetical protein
MKVMKAKFAAAMYVLKVAAGFNSNISLFDFDVNPDIDERELSEYMTSMSKRSNCVYIDESLAPGNINISKDALYVEPRIDNYTKILKINQN